MTFLIFWFNVAFHSFVSGVAMSLSFPVKYLGVSRTIQSGEKTHVFTEVWVKFPDKPYPVQVDVYGQLSIPAGDYSVPVIVGLDRNGRLSASLDFSAAKPVRAE